MSETYYNPLSDMGSIKEKLVSLLKNNTEISKLATHYSDTPYTEGAITDNGCGIFIDTYLIKVANQRIKEVGITIYVVCHKDFATLSEEEQNHYNSIGIYGNRVDCIIQAIHSALIQPEVMDEIKKKFSIGDLTFVEEEPIKPYIPETNYCGKQMSYTYQSFYQKKTR